MCHLVSLQGGRDTFAQRSHRIRWRRNRLQAKVRTSPRGRHVVIMRRRCGGGTLNFAAQRQDATFAEAWVYPFQALFQGSLAPLGVLVAFCRRESLHYSGGGVPRCGHNRTTPTLARGRVVVALFLSRMLGVWVTCPKRHPCNECFGSGGAFDRVWVARVNRSRCTSVDESEQRA